VTLSDLANFPTTWIVARLFCDSWASCGYSLCVQCGSIMFVASNTLGKSSCISHLRLFEIILYNYVVRRKTAIITMGSVSSRRSLRLMLLL